MALMKIFVRKLNGDTIPVIVKGSDTVEHLRIKILKKEGVPPEQQRLIHRGQILEDGRTLRSYNIRRGFVYLMVGLVGGEFPAPPLEIFVFEPFGMCGTSGVSIMVDGSDAVEVLKLYILEETGVPLDRQRLIYRRQKLQNGRTMRSYGITQGSTVHLQIMRLGVDGFPVPHLKDGRTMVVFVITLTGLKMPFYVEDSSTVEDLMLKIQKEWGVPPDAQRLIHCGKQLEYFRTLLSYGVVHNSTLHLVLRMVGGSPGYFVDLENKDAMQKVSFTDVEGQYRWWSAVNSGLNIEGKCTQTSCAAYDKRVIHQMGYRVFNVTRDYGDVHCPSCKDAIRATSCGFMKCEWMYEGRKKGSDATVSSEWHVVGAKQYERFREAGNMIDWDFLIIKAKERTVKLLPAQCPICLYDVCSFAEPESLACGCRFHSECVASWKTRETHCPTCRAEICGESPIARLESRLEINCTSPSPRHNGSLSSGELCHEGEAMPVTENRFRRFLSCLGLVRN